MAYKDESKRREYFKEYNKTHKEENNARQAKWVKDNPEKRAVIAKRYRENNPDKVKQYNLKKVGWNVDYYNSALCEQENLCSICKQAMESPQADHNHTTGIHRRILCIGCNVGLGAFKDNPSVLRKAAEYIEKHINLDKAALVLATMLCGLPLPQEV